MSKDVTQNTKPKTQNMKLRRQNTGVTSTITKTRLYNFDPLTPLLYSKTGVYRRYTLVFSLLLKNIDFGATFEPPPRGGSNEYPQSLFWAELWKISDFIDVKILQPKRKTFLFWLYNFFNIFD